MEYASKNILKWLRSLQYLKIRNKEQCFLIEGEKLINEAIQFHPKKIRFLFYLDTYNYPNMAHEAFKVYKLKKADLSKISSMKNPSKCFAVLDFICFPKKGNEGLALACDNIQDPGNFGTMIRTADWFNIDTIFASKNTVDKYNSKVIQSTMGSIFRVNVEYVDLKETFKETNRKIIGTTLNGKELTKQTVFDADSIILMGNEGKGISDDLLPFLDAEFAISGKGFAESLNVGVATGIFLAFFTSK
ncbi:MAG: RNA methyltransferase [Crocinitomicaceae bacterium]|nr:RNA methyltransferase [Crocinitomicaceae bacterium]